MTALTNATLSTELMVPLLRELARMGPEIEQRARETGLAILAAQGLAIDSFSDLAERIPYSTAIALLENALLVTDDPAFALRAGSAVERGDFGLFHLLTGAAPTLRASIELAQRFFPLLNDGATLELAVVGPLATWKHRPTHGVPSTAAANDYVVAAFHFGVRHMLGVPARPLEVCMMHEAPRYQAVYTTIFGAPVRFGCECNAILMPSAGLGLPLATADAPLLRLLETLAQERLPRVQRVQPFVQRVRDLTRGRLDSGITLVELADLLHMSESNVQRRLRALGTSHSEVLDDVRRECAVALLADHELNIGEVGTRLGFAHRPAFHRAFRRWYGCSPSEYRARAPRSEFYRFYGTRGDA